MCHVVYLTVPVSAGLMMISSRASLNTTKSFSYIYLMDKRQTVQNDRLRCMGQLLLKAPKTENCCLFANSVVSDEAVHNELPHLKLYYYIVCPLVFEF